MSTNHHIQKPEDLFLYVSRKDVCEAVGVGKSAISNAVKSGAFPSSWYGPMQAMMADKGHALPTTLFRWLSDAPERSA